MSSLSVTLREATAAGGDALIWHYGSFLQAVINFVIVALIVFCVLKAVMSAKGIITPKYGKSLTKAEYKKLKKEGKTKEEIAEIDKQLTDAKEVEEAKKKAEEAANSTEGLLKKIVEELEEIKSTKKD